MKLRVKTFLLMTIFIILGINIVIYANEIPHVKEGMEFQYGFATPESIKATGDPIAYTATASDWFYDSDGDDLTYSLSLLSPDQDDIGVYSIDSTNGEIVYNPSQNAAGKKINFIVYASDGSGMIGVDNVHITVTVNPIPDTNDSVLLIDRQLRFNDTIVIPYISNGNRLTRIEFDDKALINGIDYTFTDTVITLQSNLLRQLSEGKNTFYFMFSGGNTQVGIVDIPDHIETEPQCSISVFDTNGNIFYMDQVEKNSVFELDDYIPSSNKVFKGWFTEPNGNGAQWFSGSAVISNLKLYPYIVDNEDVYIIDISIDGYNLDFDPNTYLYFIPLSNTSSGLDIKVDTSYDSVNVYWSIISDGYVKTIDTTCNSIHLEPEEITCGKENRIVVSSQDPDTESSMSYSLIIQNGGIKTNILHMDADMYSAYYKPTVQGLSTAIADFGDSCDISLSYGSLKETPLEYAEIERTLKEKYQEVFFYDIGLQLIDKTTGDITDIAKSYPIDLTILSPLPAAFGYEYAIYYIADNNLEEINVCDSNKYQVRFQTSKYGRYVICYNKGVNIQFISDNSEYDLYSNIKKGSEIELPEAPSKSSYSFKGWFTEPNGKGEQILNGHKIYEDTVLYAYFVRISSRGSRQIKTTPDPTFSPSPALDKTKDKNSLNERHDVIKVSTTSNEIEIFVNEEKICFPDTQPFIDSHDRTLAPIRPIVEAIGYDVDWIQDSQTAVLKKGDMVITIEIGNSVVFINNDTFTMDTVAQIKNDRTFIPVRAIGELIGYTIEWLY